MLHPPSATTKYIMTFFLAGKPLTNNEAKVTANDIKLPANVTVVNGDEHIGTITDKKTKLEITIWVENGLGYLPSEERSISEMNVIPVDSLYSPVKLVNFSVEETRSWRVTYFDKLILDVWTNGAVDPETVLKQASKTIVSYFQHIYNPTEHVSQKKEESGIEPSVLSASVEELELPIRITNALKKGGFKTIGDFEGKARADIEKVRNLGVKSIDQIQGQLKERGVEVSWKKPAAAHHIKKLYLPT